MEQKAQTGGWEALRGSHISFAQPVELFEKAEFPAFENSEGHGITTWQPFAVLCRCGRSTPGCHRFLCPSLSPLDSSPFINLHSLPSLRLL